MKLRPQTSFVSPIKTALTTLSVKRLKERTAITDRPSATTTRLKFNVSGNRRGMHNQDHPPGPEHMRRVRAMQSLDNNMMPTLACSSCAFSASCPQFKASYQCAFVPFLKSHKINSQEDVMFYMKQLCTSQVQRAQMLLIFEKLSGGKPDIETSESLAHVFNQLKQMQETISTVEGVSVELETNDASILSRLFGGLDQLVSDTTRAQSEVVSLDNIGEATLLGMEETMEDQSSNELVRELSSIRSSETLRLEESRLT